MKIKLRFINAFITCSLTFNKSSNEMDMLAMRHICISSKFSLYATVRQIQLLATDSVRHILVFYIKV